MNRTLGEWRLPERKKFNSCQKKLPFEQKGNFFSVLTSKET